MKQKNFWAVVAVIMAMFITSIIPVNGVLHNEAFAADDKRSKIASIVVDGMSRQEMTELLQQEIERWTSQDITISGGGATVNLDASSLQFAITDSIDRYEMLTKKPWYAFWKKKPVAQIPLSVLLTDDASRQLSQVPQWHYEETSNNLIAQASYLKSHEIEAAVNEDAEDISQQLLATVVQPFPKNSVGIQELIEPFYEYTLTSHAEFSYLELLAGQQNLADDEALNFVASMLYSAALQMNSEIIERHSQHVIPSYLEPGIEAAVEKNGTKDLRFVNATDEAIQLQFIVQGEELKLEAYASNLVTPATIRVERVKEIEPRVIARYSTDLAMGRERVIEEGQEGVRVLVYRSHTESEEELIGKDYYAPVNRVILKSARVPEPEPEYVPGVSQGTASDVDINSVSSEPSYNESLSGVSSNSSSTSVPTNSLPDVTAGDASTISTGAKQKADKMKKKMP